MFVNAGGIDLKEINMTTMQSRTTQSLFCCGQVLNVDGTSIGYTRMLDWVTGYTAGVNAAKCIMHI